MRIGRLLLGAPLALLATGLAAAWCLPPLLDWDHYRDSIATFASARLGREVRIAGPVKLTLLPEPVVTATGVSLTDAGDGITIRAAQLRLRVALGALIGGRFDAEELVLRGADIRVPWSPPPAQIPAVAPEWLGSASVRVEDGTLTIGGLTFGGIRAMLSTDVWTGSYAATGTLQFAARPWHFSARLTRAGSDGAAGFDAAVDGRGALLGFGARLSGQIHGDGTFGGRVTGRGTDLSQLLPAPAVPFSAEGRVSVAAGLLAVDELAGDIGGAPVTGAVALRVAPEPRLDLAVAAGRLDLDLWLPALLRGGPAPLPTSIDLSAEAVQLAGGTLRRLRAGFDLSGGAVAVRELRAVLPGEASLGATGHLLRRTATAPARFEGDVALSAPALRTTLGWLESVGVPPLAALPAGALRNADLTARMSLGPDGLSLARLDGTTGSTRLSGSLAFRPGERPTLTASLQADRFDIDAWLPAAWPTLASLPSRLDAMDAGLQLSARQLVLRGVPFGPASLDAGITGGQVTLRRLDLAEGALHASVSGSLGEGGRIADGRIDIRAPSATALAEVLPASLAGLREVTRFWRGPAVVVVQAAGPPEALGVRVAGDLGDLRLEAQPVVDLPARRASGVLTLRHPGAPRLAESLGFRGAPSWLGDGSLGLLAQMSVQLPVTLPGEGRAGTLQPGRIAAEQFDLTAGSLRASGSLSLDAIASPDTPPFLSGRVVADTLPLPLPYPRSPDPLPFSALAGWRAKVRLEAAHVLAGASPVLEQAAASLLLRDGTVRVEGLSARLGGGALTGTASADVTAEPPAVALDMRVEGAMLSERLFELPVDIEAGRMDGSLSFTASGYSPAALLSTLTGEVRLAIFDGTLAGFSLGSIGTHGLSETAVLGALSGGTTAFTRAELALRARRGVLQVIDGRMDGECGAATLAGSVDLAGNAAELRLGLLPAVAEPPEIGLRLAGPMDQLSRVPELAGLARWRAEHDLSRN